MTRVKGELNITINYNSIRISFLSYNLNEISYLIFIEFFSSYFRKSKIFKKTKLERKDISSLKLYNSKFCFVIAI